MSEWVWEPDDFAALWYSDANDRLPNLLRYTSRFVTRDEFDAHKIEVRRRYDTDELERVQLALHALTASDMRIEIFCGTNKYKGSRGDERQYRIIGARTPHHAAVLHQLTQGPTEGRIRLRLCRPENLPTRIAATMPARNPGTGPPLTVHPDDVRDGHATATGNAPHERYRRLFAGPIDGGGSALLRAGAFNTTPEPWNHLQWYDFPDGRYAETRGDHITLRPATAQDLSTRFTSWIDRALQRLREDEEDRWYA
ncbi:MAG: ESX secretion-associated protein EspG [Nocardia sp.]|nr:ESX secretion-associated protein EspG [Nocardia sp.]